MSGHHLVISGEGALRIRCDEPATAACHAVFDCLCDPDEEWTTEGGDPYHAPVSGEGDIHVGRFVPAYCNVEDWFSEEEPEDLLRGEYAIPLYVEWDDNHPILHLPEPTNEET